MIILCSLLAMHAKEQLRSSEFAGGMGFLGGLELIFEFVLVGFSIGLFK